MNALLTLSLCLLCPSYGQTQDCLTADAPDPTGIRSAVEALDISTSGPVPPNVVTEVLYSWQMLPNVLEWAATAPKTQLFRSNYLYAWRTPTATFAYGDVPIRIKLKNGVRFAALARDKRDCKLLPEEEKRKTVYYSALGENTLDYLVCSHDVIHSWSFGTQEGLEEIKREINYNVKNPGKGDYYGYHDQSCPDCIFGKLDDQPKVEWRKESLDKKVSFLEKFAHSDLPRVICLGDQRDCVKDHFALNDPKVFGPVPVSENISTKPLSIVEKTAVIYVDAELIEKNGYSPITKILIENSPGLEVRVIGDGFPVGEPGVYKKRITRAEFLKLCQESREPIWVASLKEQSSNAVNFTLPGLTKENKDYYVNQGLLESFMRAKLALKSMRLGVGSQFEYAQKAANTSSLATLSTLAWDGIAFRFQDGKCQKFDLELQGWSATSEAQCLLNR